MAYDVGTTWTRVDHEPAHFRLALTLAQVEECPPERTAGRGETLLQDVSSALTASHRGAAFVGELCGDEPNAWSKAASLLEAHRH